MRAAPARCGTTRAGVQGRVAPGEKVRRLSTTEKTRELPERPPDFRLQKKTRELPERPPDFPLHKKTRELPERPPDFRLHKKTRELPERPPDFRLHKKTRELPERPPDFRLRKKSRESPCTPAVPGILRAACTQRASEHGLTHAQAPWYARCSKVSRATRS